MHTTHVIELHHNRTTIQIGVCRPSTTTKQICQGTTGKLNFTCRLLLEARSCHAFAKRPNKIRRCCQTSFTIKRRHSPSSLGRPIRFFHEPATLDKLEYRSIAVRGSVRGEMGAPELGNPKVEG